MTTPPEIAPDPAIPSALPQPLTRVRVMEIPLSARLRFAIEYACEESGVACTITRSAEQNRLDLFAYDVALHGPYSAVLGLAALLVGYIAFDGDVGFEAELRKINPEEK